ncbi:MAG: asparagine synthase (glutamine-hydrolyzing) [Brevundimonas sp.]|jgi:asparagine synthase (glutamine-hydrolysing)|uniref:asparagine synthase (glutamine-hydrolyzing) n=1 Tax=Brevundimonas sp. TaxID=1871086 RepID=UPI00391D238E
MCGFVFSATRRPVPGFIRAAHARQRHRGPDGEGISSEQVGDTHIAMAHQRLAIVDLSDNGAQPMDSASGRYRIVFNGEIYNYQELAAQFGIWGGVTPRSGTDTEVALELIERLGMDEACRHFNGMWAMVVHDRREGRVLISRDRFGKKPLYVFADDSGVYLASEMHSLLGLEGVRLEADTAVAARYLAQSLQNADERSWIAGISAFPPASIGEIDVSDPGAGIVRLRRFWQPPLDAPLAGGDDLIENLRALVEDSVRLRLHADVPVGVALSGGLDSSIIALQAARRAGHEVTLFSAVNPGSRDDESAHIDAMAGHIGANVRKYRLDPGEGEGLASLLRRCIRHGDGPLSSFSSVLFYKLMESARDAGITVVLTGQGADEAFCGYRKYPILEIKRRLQARQLASAARLAAGFIANGTLLPEFNLREAKRYMGGSNRAVLGPMVAEALTMEPLSHIGTLAGRQWADISRYSVPWLCHYEDRMSMAWSREVRSPYLDYRVIEMGLRMPEDLKLSGGWTKYALRRAFADDLPRSIAWRKDKKGFVNPQDDWLKGALKSDVLEVMSAPDARVYGAGLVDRAGYLEQFGRYCASSGAVWFREVFAPYALELWLRELDAIRSGLRAAAA